MTPARAPSTTIVLLLAIGQALGASCGSEAPAPPAVDAGPAVAAATDAGRQHEKRETASRGPGRWRRFKPKRYQRALTEQQHREIAQLQAVGYLRGSTPAPALIGVTRHDPKRAFQGLNLYNAGHEASAYLIDMNGRLLHSWSAAFDSVFPAAAVAGDRRSLPFWRRVKLLPGGELLVIWDGHGMAKLDRSSQVIWKRPNRAHHDIDITANGQILTLSRDSHVVPRVNAKHAILEDFILVLDPDGNEIRRVSLIEAFERSDEYRRIWTESGRTFGDVFHTNAVELLDGRAARRNSAFAAGRVLVSIRFLDAIAVVDLDLGEVVWAKTGVFSRQHDPTVLNNGRLLLFDNLGRKRYSSVQEYDLNTMTIRWEYRGSKQRPFYSHTCGAAQRLPNGNTLITESDAGRAFEVTRGKQIVWEFWNPHRAGNDGEYIATLFEVQRIDRADTSSWLTARGSSR